MIHNINYLLLVAHEVEEINILDNLLFSTTLLLEKLYSLTVAILFLYLLYLSVIALKIYIKKNKVDN